METIDSYSDNRNYFRLRGAIGISFSAIDQKLSEEITDPYEHRLQVPPILALLNQSREGQVDCQSILKQIRGKNTLVSRYLERMNERLDYLQQCILLINQSFPTFQWQISHYSEAGLNFFGPANHLLDLNHKIHLILAIPAPDEEPIQDNGLLPLDHSYYAPYYSPLGFISVICRITQINSTECNDTRAYGCAFEALSEFDRQFLARHILSVQSYRRRVSNLSE